MKLEVNTNGAWKTILAGLWGEQCDEAMAAVAVLARLDAEMRDAPGRGKPAIWRLVSEGDGKVARYCTGALGWGARCRSGRHDPHRTTRAGRCAGEVQSVP